MTAKNVNRPELRVGELVTIDDYKASTGGLIYRITKRGEPIKPAHTQRNVVSRTWQYHSGKWGQDKIPENGEWREYKRRTYGCWDENWKKFSVFVSTGYVRLSPAYEFYPTTKGKNPSGKDSTVLVRMNEYQFGKIKHVTLPELARKYSEMGKLISDFVNLKSASTHEDDVDFESDDDERESV